MIDKLEPKKLGLLGSLYVTQFLPIAFFLQALPAFLRQSGASLATIGLIYTVALPWLFKFIWSPLIDRYGWTRWGHYRFWIICLQSLTALILVISAFLDVQNDFVVLFVCLFVIGFLAATQDIATDALAVSLLDERERKIGNGVQIAGNFLGAIVGGGGMLILLDRIGWTASVLLMALCTVLALIPTLQYEERGREKGNFIQNSKLKKSYFKTLTNFFRRPGGLVVDRATVHDWIGTSNNDVSAAASRHRAVNCTDRLVDGSCRLVCGVSGWISWWIVDSTFGKEAIADAVWFVASDRSSHLHHSCNWCNEFACSVCDRNRI